MIEKYELISENDIHRFNSQFEKIGITAGHDLLGSPVVYVDHNLLRKSLGVKLAAKRRYITEEAKQKVIELRFAGKNYRSISKETGISLGSITKILSKKI